MRPVHLPRTYVRAVQRAADALVVAAADGAGEPVALDPGHEADPGMRRLGAITRRVEQDPGLRLAEPRAQVLAGPGAIRVRVQRHRASRREQLDQYPGDRPPALREAGADHLLGQGLDDLPERHGPDARQSARPHSMSPAIWSPGLGRGS